jgi:quercetin dioxygenase-like cupin family protein
LEDPVVPQHFPAPIRTLPPFEGPFDAFRLEAQNCEVLFASYPAGTEIPSHSHESQNCGVITRGELILIIDDTEQRLGPGQWYSLAPGQLHAARFEVATSEVEFWFGSPADVPPNEGQ